MFVVQTIKKNSTADISLSFMLFTIYKEIQIGFSKLLNQYKLDWQNPECDYFWKNIWKIGILELWKREDKRKINFYIITDKKILVLHTHTDISDVIP